MVRAPWRHPPLTPEQEDELFMVLLEDDTEDAPWMTMGDLQFWSASSFAHSLRIYGHQQGLGWYVASMLPILYRWQNEGRKKQLSPDTFVAFVPEHPRTSYDVEIEGAFPPFILEVVSPSSTERDQIEKSKAYDLLGAKEYVLFTPHLGTASQLEGYRRDAEGRFVAWPLDDEGRLYSAVLGLHLVARGEMLYAQAPDGSLLLTPEEAVNELQRVEAEAERLRRELKRYRREARDR